MKEAEALYKFLVQCPHGGRALITGSRLYEGSYDRRGWYKDPYCVDMLPGDGVDLVHDLEEPLDQGKFNHVDCCSVLEHVRRPWLFAENIQNVLEPSGTILVSVPFVWRMHAYPSDYWRMTPEAMPALFPEIEWKQRQIFAHGKPCKKPGVLTEGKRSHLERCEVFAFGVKKCA